MSIDYIPGLAGVPATQSRISDIDGELGQLYYRGYAVEELAAHSTFEETAYLLLSGELPKQQQLDEFSSNLKKHRKIKLNIERIMQSLPMSADPMQVLQVGVTTLSSFFPATEVDREGIDDPSKMFEASVTILSHVATLVAIWEHMRNGYRPVAPRLDLGYAENFLYMVYGEEPDDYLVRLFDTCLVLHAEHTINASTFTAMVTASTLANPCSVISAAIASLSGPLHGGANLAVVQMIEQIGDVSKVEAFIDGRLKNKEVIWGMGHREYKTKDPRARILENMMQELLGKEGSGSKKLEIAREVERICEDRLAEKGVYPNVDFYSGILYQEMNLRRALFTPIFAISRTAGWLAHFNEQLSHNRIFRPTQIYQGSKPRSYLPIIDRT